VVPSSGKVRPAVSTTTPAAAKRFSVRPHIEEGGSLIRTAIDARSGHLNPDDRIVLDRKVADKRTAFLDVAGGTEEALRPLQALASTPPVSTLPDDGTTVL